MCNFWENKFTDAALIEDIDLCSIISDHFPMRMSRILIRKAKESSRFSFAFKNISFFEIIITKFIFTSKCIKAIEIILPLATRLIIYIFHILFFIWMLPLLFLHLLLILPSSQLGNVANYVVIFIGAFLILLYDEGKSYLIHVPSIIYID